MRENEGKWEEKWRKWKKSKEKEYNEEKWRKKV